MRPSLYWTSLSKFWKEISESYILVFEFMKGEDLRQGVKAAQKRPLSEEVSQFYIFQIVPARKYSHDFDPTFNYDSTHKNSYGRI